MIYKDNRRKAIYEKKRKGDKIKKRRIVKEKD